MTSVFSNRKGIAFVWLGILFVIVAMGLIFLVLDQPLTKVRDMNGDKFTGTIYEPTYDKMNTVWDKWPVIFLLGVILFGVLTTLRKEQNGG